MLHAGRGQHQSALEDFATAARLQSSLMGAFTLAPWITGWLAVTQNRLGMPNEARATLDAYSGPSEQLGRIYNARAMLLIAEGDPAGA
jgi:LuxR family maltose regulon positive regulatory protein